MSVSASLIVLILANLFVVFVVSNSVLQKNFWSSGVLRFSYFLRPAVSLPICLIFGDEKDIIYLS